MRVAGGSEIYQELFAKLTAATPGTIKVCCEVATE
jgi:hypothetical protein